MEGGGEEEDEGEADFGWDDLSEQSLLDTLNDYIDDQFEATGKQVFEPVSFTYLVKEDTKVQRQDCDIAALSPYFDRTKYPKRIILAHEIPGGIGYKYFIFCSMKDALKRMFTMKASMRNFYAIAERSEYFGRHGDSPAIFFFADMEIDHQNRDPAIHGDSMERLIRISHEATFGLMESFFGLDLSLWHKGEAAIYVSGSSTKWSAHEHVPLAFASIDEYTPFMRKELYPVFEHLIEVLKMPVLCRLRYVSTNNSGTRVVSYFFDYKAFSANRNLRLPGNTKYGKNAFLTPSTVPGINDKKLSWHGVEYKRPMADTPLSGGTGVSFYTAVTDAMILCKNSPGFWNSRTMSKPGSFIRLPVYYEVKKNMPPLISESRLAGEIETLGGNRTAIKKVFLATARDITKMLLRPISGIVTTFDDDEAEMLVSEIVEFPEGPGRACSFVLSMIGFFQLPGQNEIQSIYLNYSTAFLCQIKSDVKEGLSLVMADLFLRRMLHYAAHYHQGEHEKYPETELTPLREDLAKVLQCHKDCAIVLSKSKSFPANQLVLLAATHMVMSMRLELANDDPPVKLCDYILTERGRARFCSVFPRIISEALTAWSFIALQFHDCNLKTRAQYAMPNTD